MNRTTLARRYAPLVALAAIQLLIIATVPSKVPSSTLSSGRFTPGSTFNPGAAGGAAGGTTAATGATGGTAAASGGGAIAYSGGGAGASSLAGGGAHGGAGAPGSRGGGGPNAVALAGDTHHCAGGREFDPGIAWYAPPCAPGTPGAPYPNNGGNTSMGASSNTITIVDYNGDAGAEVDAILQAEGLYESFQAAQTMDKAMAAFMNKYFVTYGRQIVIKTYQGQCTTVPPDTNCLIPEMDKIAAQYQPFAVYWNTTLCSACFAELASKGVVTFGGSGFSDAFSNANAPYFYSAGESSTRIEEAFAEFYCKQLKSGNVQFAETGNPAQNFNGKPRVLGIISTNDPDNENTVKQVLVPALAQCGVSVTHFYFYAQDINTAAQQVAAGIAAMDTPTNPASIVLCLCDPVAPAFLYEGEKSNNYFPENVIATDQGMDLDKAAQSYESGLGCPGGGQCEFDNAFGLSTTDRQEPSTNNDGTRIYALGGGPSPMPVDPTIGGVIAREYVLMASLIENVPPSVGPLTPANMAARAPALGAIGGGSSGHELLQFQPNDYQWTQDARVVFWDRNQKSSYNNSPGTYIEIEGGRFNLGQFPVIPNGEPPVPATRP